MRISDWSSDVCSSDLEPGRLVTTKDLLGTPYVLNVWGSWCPECRVEHPVLSRFALTKRVRVLGYNLKDEPEDALRWLEQFGNPYMLVLADRDGRAAIDWGIYGAPETFLVDAEGIVRWKHRSEEHTSELQSLMRISYAVFCLKKKKTYYTEEQSNNTLYTTLISIYMTNNSAT